MYYDIYTRDGNHWRLLNRHSMKTAGAALKTFDRLKKENTPVVLIGSNQARNVDAALRFVKEIANKKEK